MNSNPRTAGTDLAALFDNALDLMPPATRITIDNFNVPASSTSIGAAEFSPLPSMSTAAISTALSEAHITRFTVSYFPHYTLWLNRPLSFDFRVGLAFPATPPVVTVSQDIAQLLAGDSAAASSAALVSATSIAEAAHLDGQGRPQLSILTTESLGWMKSYTLADIIHCLRRCFMKAGCVVHTVSPSPPFTASLLPELPLHFSGSSQMMPPRQRAPSTEDAEAAKLSTAPPSTASFSFGTTPPPLVTPLGSARSRSSSNVLSPLFQPSRSSFHEASEGTARSRRGSRGDLASARDTVSSDSLPEGSGGPLSPAADVKSPMSARKMQYSDKRRGSASTVVALGLAGFSNMNGAGAISGSACTSRPSTSSLGQLQRTSSGSNVPLGPLLPLHSGHAGLLGRRPTMEDNAVYLDNVSLRVTCAPADHALTSARIPEGEVEPAAAPAEPATFSTSVAFYGVYDGHGGTRASEFVAERLHRIVFDRLQEGKTPSEALHSAFQQVDNDFERNLIALQQAAVAAERERRSSCYSQALPTPSSTPRSPMLGAAPPFGDPPAFTVSAERRDSTSSTPFSFNAGFTGGSLGDFDNPEALDDQSGCTAVAALLNGNLQSGGSITVANAGDSRVVLCREAKAVPLSIDHKAKRQDERARILWAGGMIMRGRVLGRLAVTRAIGDLSLKRGAGEQYLVTAEPEVFELPLSPTDEFLIVACDGIWDVMESQEAVDFVRHELVRGSSCEAAAKALAKRAFELGSADNLTAVVVSLGDGPVEGIAAVISPPPIAAAMDADDEKNDFLDKLLESVAGPSRYGTAAVPVLSAPAPASAPLVAPVPAVTMAPVPPTASVKKQRGPNPFARATRRAAGEHVAEKEIPVIVSGAHIAPAPAPVEETQAPPAPEQVPTPSPEAPKQAPTYGRRAVRPEGSRSPAPSDRRSPSPAASPAALPPLAIQESVKPSAPLRNSFPERLPARQYHGGSYISLLPLGAGETSRRNIARLPATILSPASADAAIAATAAAIQATSRTAQQEPFHSLTTDALTMAVGSRGDSVGTAMARLGRARTLLPADSQSRRGGSWSLPPPHARFGSVPSQGSDLVSNLRVGIPLSKMGDDSKASSPALQEHGRFTVPGRQGLAAAGAAISSTSTSPMLLPHAPLRSPASVIAELTSAPQLSQRS